MVNGYDDIRQILKTFETLPPGTDMIGEDEDLFEKGLDSFTSVQLMLALEQRFDVEFPDSLLNRRSFSTIRHIHRAIATLRPEMAV